MVLTKETLDESDIQPWTTDSTAQCIWSQVTSKMMTSGHYAYLVFIAFFLSILIKHKQHVT